MSKKAEPLFYSSPRTGITSTPKKSPHVKNLTGRTDGKRLVTFQGSSDGKKPLEKTQAGTWTKSRDATPVKDENTRPAVPTRANTPTKFVRQNSLKVSSTRKKELEPPRTPTNSRQGGGSGFTTPLVHSAKVNRVASVRQAKSPARVNTTPKKAVAPSPNRAERSVLFEFNDDILATPKGSDDGDSGKTPSLSITSQSFVQIETPKAMPRRQLITAPQSSHRTAAAPRPILSRSKSASLLVRGEGGGEKPKEGPNIPETCTPYLGRSASEAKLNSGGEEVLGVPLESETSRLVVGVRVRPLHNREHGNAVFVKDKEVSVASDLGSVHCFNYDHCFTSSGETEATQSQVFEALARPLLENAFKGYNACLFAYGQTGSGKTYSMMGELSDDQGVCEASGVIPRFCQEILQRCNTDGSMDDQDVGRCVNTSVEISFLEVYNEKIRDLLVTAPPGQQQPLRVREHPLYGPYVVDLSKHTVNSCHEIHHWLNEGNKKRATAATEMNDKSSRSHSLFTIILTQTYIQAGPDGEWNHEQTRRSTINLVDLAGSERLANSVSSDRLREGVSINRSLLTLGKVITALVEKRGFCPYRESVLTWLLKDSLGGNSRTAMLATVSPCSANIDETLATLRYASQARTIVNTVHINEAPQDKIIRALRAEVEKLRELRLEVEKAKLCNLASSPLVASTPPVKREKLARLEKDLKETKEKLEVTRRNLDEKSRDYEELSREAERLRARESGSRSRLERDLREIQVELEDLKQLQFETQEKLLERDDRFREAQEVLKEMEEHKSKLEHQLRSALREREQAVRERERVLKTSEMKLECEKAAAERLREDAETADSRSRLESKLEEIQSRLEALRGIQYETQEKLVERDHGFREALHELKRMEERKYKLEKELRYTLEQKENKTTSKDNEKVDHSVKALEGELRVIQDELKELKRLQFETQSKVSERNDIVRESQQVLQEVQWQKSNLEKEFREALQDKVQALEDNRKERERMGDERESDSWSRFECKLREIQDSLEGLRQAQIDTRGKVVERDEAVRETHMALFELEREKSKIELELGCMKQDERDKEERLSELKKRNKELEKELCKYKELSVRREEELRESKEKHREATEAIEFLREELKSRRDAFNSIEGNNQEFRAEIQSYTESMVNWQKELQELQKSYRSLVDDNISSLKKMEEGQPSKKAKDNSHELILENRKLIEEVKNAEESVKRKQCTIERLKRKISNLEDCLKEKTETVYSTPKKQVPIRSQESTPRVQQVPESPMKSEQDVKMYEIVMETAYPNHWEFLLRKARTLAQQYKIPYVFEMDSASVIVKHLMLSMKVSWNRREFSKWIEKIENEKGWSRAMDREVRWEVDFGKYFDDESPLIDDDGTQEEVVNSESAINIGTKVNRHGCISPKLWRHTLVKRHMAGIKEDTNALIKYFGPSGDCRVNVLLDRLKSLLERLETVADLADNQ